MSIAGMFCSAKRILIKQLGGHTEAEMEVVKQRLEQSEFERDQYKQFAESVYIYMGNYPVWKAQSEYRQMMSEKGMPLSGEFSQPPTRAECVDLYLGRIVDSFADLLRSAGREFSSSERFMDEMQLSEARGKMWLKPKK